MQRKRLAQGSGKKMSSFFPESRVQIVKWAREVQAAGECGDEAASAAKEAAEGWFPASAD
jgi:hypothetical protein